VLTGLGEEFPFTDDTALLTELCEDRGLHLPGELREADRAALAIEWAQSRLQRSGD
jgi:hypothetical protein